MAKKTPEQRAARRHKRRRGFVALFLIGLAVIFAGLWLVPAEDADQTLIQAERRQRALRAAFGMALPGTPDLANLNGRLEQHGVKLGSPVFVRIFKREFELELWMLRDGKFHRFATYPICRWSGRLGPKFATGDRQAPEGFYSVDSKSLNPKSRWHRSFNLGYPNAFDRAHARTGSFLMVHGGCSSVGCYAMTDAVIDEVWRIVTAALDQGQKRFQVQVLPFRLTGANIDRYSGHMHAAFWRSLKPGYDLFEADHLPPVVSLCGKQYTFSSGARAKDVSGPIVSQCQTVKPDSRTTSDDKKPRA
jgi:murein L,D-transpeptidase YafK